MVYYYYYYYSLIRFALTREPEEKCLDLSEKIFCDQELTEGEIFDAIMTLKPNKVPGLDGFTPDFYRKLFKYLKGRLMKMYQFSFDTGILPMSVQRGVISLIPKKLKDTRKICNMRPLVLLNTDFKILSKALDNRIRTVLPNIINHNQSGFLKGRNISFNIRKSLDIIDYMGKNKIPAVILSVQFW